MKRRREGKGGAHIRQKISENTGKIQSSIQSKVHRRRKYGDIPFSSPPLSPPIAYPATLSRRSTISSKHRSRKTGSSPPCTMANRFWLSLLPDFSWNSMHRSSQRTDRSIASPTRGPTVRLDTLAISAGKSCSSTRGAKQTNRTNRRRRAA